MERRNDGAFGHDEADITMVSCVIQAANYGKYVIRMVSDDTDVNVLKTGLLGTQSSITVQGPHGQMDRNSTRHQCNLYSVLGPKCLQLLSVHALNGCNTTSYLYSTGKTRASHTLLSGNFPGLHSVFGEKGISKAELMQAVNPFITFPV